MSCRGRVGAGLVGVLLLGALFAAAFAALPALLRQAVESALEDSDNFVGEIGPIDLSLWRAEAVVRGVHVRAISGREVLEVIDAPTARVRWRWKPLLRGHFTADVVAERPVVAIATKTGEDEGDDDDDVPDPGWFRFALDIRAVDGVFVFHDAETTPNAHITLAPVNGTIENLGTLPGPARFDLTTFTPGGGRVRFDGLMDFFNADKDAFDIRFLVGDLPLAELPTAAEAYLGTALTAGTLDARFGLTLDRGRRELPAGRRFFAPVDDLQTGTLVLTADVRGARLAEVPLTTDRVILYADGPVHDGDAFRIRADVDGAELLLDRAHLSATDGGDGDDTPAEDLAAMFGFRVEHLDVADLDVRFRDDTLDPPLQVVADGLSLVVQGFDNLPETPDPAHFVLHGPFAGGSIGGAGTFSLDVWPPRLAVRGRVDDLALRRIAGPVRRFVDIDLLAGRLDLRARYDNRGAVVAKEAFAEVVGGAARVTGWRGEVTRAELDLVGARGAVADLVLDPPRGGVLRSIEAHGARVSWSNRHLLDDVIVARVEAGAPLVVFGPPDEGEDEDDDGDEPVWTLDVVSRDGRLVWRDPTTDPPVEVLVDAIEGRIERLGTMYPSSHWDLEGALRTGGEVALVAEMDPVGSETYAPWQLAIDAFDVPLTPLQDVARAYLGHPLFAAGRGDGRLTMVWDPDGVRRAPPERSLGCLQIAGRDVVFAEPPFDAASMRTLWADVTWDPDRDGPYQVEGVGTGLRVRMGASEAAPADDAAPGPSEGGPASEMLADLPAMRIRRFDVHDATVAFTLPIDGEPVPFVAEGVELRARNLHNLTGDQSLGTLLGAGSVLGADLTAAAAFAPLSPRPDFELLADLRGVEAARVQAHTRRLVGLDADEGAIDLTTELRARDGELSGDLRTVLRGVDVLQADDLGDGLGSFLESVAASVLLELADTDDVATVDFPVRGTLDDPEIGVIEGLLESVLDGVGVRGRGAPTVAAD